MASLLQRPWKKLGVAIVLQVPPGVGKGIIVNAFLAKIIGSHHYSHVTGLDRICGSFNAPALGTACLVFVDEAEHSSAGSSTHKQQAAKLKMLITETHHTIENKYMPSLSVESYANYILSSNEDHVVAVEPKDRRYCVLQTASHAAGSNSAAHMKQYFERLLAVPVESVARYLYELDIKEFNPRDIPRTDFQRAQKLMSMQREGVDTWLLRCIESGRMPCDKDNLSESDGDGDMVMSLAWDVARPKAAVYEHYRLHAGVHAKAVETFWRRLRDILPCHTTHKKLKSTQKYVQYVRFPTLQECKEAFRCHMADPGWKFESETELDNHNTAEGETDEGDGNPSTSSKVNDDDFTGASECVCPAKDLGHSADCTLSQAERLKNEKEMEAKWNAAVRNTSHFNFFST